MKKDINRRAAKVLALSSDKIDKFVCLTGKEISPNCLIVFTF